MPKRTIPEYDELYKLYITDNLSREDLVKYYTTSRASIDRWIAKYQIKKDKSLSIEAQKKTNKNKNYAETIKRRQATNLKRYGTTKPQQLDIVKEKAKKTNLEKYGCISSAQNAEVKEKAKQTNLERYGTEYSGQSEYVKNKIVQSNIERYSVPYPMMNANVRKKTEETLLARYGVTSVFNIAEVREKSIKAITDSTIIEKRKYTLLNKYGVENSMNIPGSLEKLRATNNERYGVDYFCLLPECYNNTNGSNSKPNNDFEELLQLHKMQYEKEFRINNYRYDFRCGNILFEIDPIATHNITTAPHDRTPIDICYHFNKTKTANENGYHCIHIFGWESPTLILDIFSQKPVIYARQCIIKLVNEKDTDTFLNTYHLQGTCRGQTISLGLYYNDDLVELMTFGKPRYNKNYEYELLRLVSGKYQITGGAEKLFKYFIKNYAPKTILSYCDNSKFSGNVYKKLGMELLSYGKPTRHWVRLNGKEHITDNLLRQRGFDQLFNTNYGNSASNEELMHKNGFVEVYDCGQSVYIWDVKK